jgi:hypothetical protein
MLNLNTTEKDGRFYIEMPEGEDIMLLLTTVHGDIESRLGSADRMQEALNDVWNSSERLSELSKKHGALVFSTPFGFFATYSFTVVSVSALVDIANKLEKRFANAQRLFTEKRMRELFPERAAITEKYGHSFADWPEGAAAKYWKAEDQVHEERKALFHAKE